MPINILMPALSPTMTVATLAKWEIKQGDFVSSGDIIAEIETDKATMELEAVEEGVIARILIEEGVDNIAINAPIAVLLEEGEKCSEEELEAFIAKSSSATALPSDSPSEGDVLPSDSPSEGDVLPSDSSSEGDVLPSDSSSEGDVLPSDSPSEGDVLPSDSPSEGDVLPSDSSSETALPSDSPSLERGRVFASPLAKRLSKQHNISIDSIKGSGPKGRVVKADIEMALKKATSDYYVLKLSNIQKVVAQRLLESKQKTPHFYLSVDCNIDKLLMLRKEVSDFADKVSINDIIIKITAAVLVKNPKVNATFCDGSFKLYNSVDISVAVAIEDGLITPIIKNADKKGISAISQEMKDLVQSARLGKLLPHQYQGGGFTISNLGMFGISSFLGIINIPQVGLLSVGEGKLQPVVNVNKEVSISTIMNVGFSGDHRVIDGAVGAKFLSDLKLYLENPLLITL